MSEIKKVNVKDVYLNSLGIKIFRTQNSVYLGDILVCNYKQVNRYSGARYFIEGDTNKVQFTNKATLAKYAVREFFVQLLSEEFQILKFLEDTTGYE